MTDYKSLRIWKKTLGQQKGLDPFKKEREKLRVSFENFRFQAATLANEIPQDLKEFTIHDVSHLDALWEMIDMVIDDKFNLNPAEAYVLGGAILTHDLGLALAAYPKGLDELKEDIFWSDTVVRLYQQVFNRYPTKDEMISPDKLIERIATKTLLRHFHAKRAESLALIHWESKSSANDIHYLIEDSQLRESYGKIIGFLAHSHWWNVDDLSVKLNTQKGAATFLPKEWSINLIKIACLLRVADVIHVDDRRSPSFLWALRELPNESNSHWRFQNKLLKPVVTTSCRLLFTSKSPFSILEAEAWWLCYDALKIIDKELNKVDSLLSESGLQRLLVFGVELIENPSMLAKHIETEGWEPIDTQIRVGSVAKIVRSLGGEELYGDNMLIPLRELIQNSSDAVRARRLIESHESSWGEVIISEGKDEFGSFLEIEDNGIGMSKYVMTGPFLDFGQTFWNTNLMLEEFPGLQSKRFIPTGKFGIGFFSSFMWGDKIKIVSRKYNQSVDENWCLEFTSIEGRPLLRKSYLDEQVANGGTKIKIWFRSLKNLEDLDSFDSLETICRYIAPSVDVNISVKKSQAKKRVVIANDWLKLSLPKLINRISNGTSGNLYDNSDEKNLGFSHELILNSDKKVVGRGFISFMYNYPGFAITTNGIRTGDNFQEQNTGTFHGIIEGKPLNAARSNSIINISPEEFGDWVTAQVERISKTITSPKEKIWYALSAISLGGNPLNLPFATMKYKDKIKFLNYSQIVKKYKNEEHCIISDVDFWDLETKNFQLSSCGIHIDDYNYHNQKILDHLDYKNYTKKTDRNRSIYWIERALKEAWSLEELKIQYFDSDELHNIGNEQKMIFALKKAGINKNNITRKKSLIDSIVAIARRY